MNSEQETRVASTTARRESGHSWTRHDLASTLALVIVTVGALVIVLPFVYTISTALKPRAEVLAVPIQWIPSEVVWSNFLEPFRQTDFARYFFNSTFVAVAVTLSNLLTCSLAGYSFSKFQYPGRNLLFFMVLATLTMPLEIIYVPLFDLVFSLGWVNTYWGLIVPAGTSAFGIFLMRQTITATPDELIEAARLDGAAELRIYFSLVLPLSKAPLAALAIFIFLNNWESLLWPLLVAPNDEYRTLPVGIAAMQSNYATDFSMPMAPAIMAMLPTVVIYFLLQRYFVSGISMVAGVKG